MMDVRPMSYLRYLLVPAILLAAVPANAAMTVGAFLDRANPIRDGGIMGMLSPDMPMLRREALDALAQMRAERDARRAAGKPPLFCKPADEPDMGVEEMVDGLNALPPRQQGLSLKDGIVRVMVRRYPC